MRSIAGAETIHHNHSSQNCQKNTIDHLHILQQKTHQQTLSWCYLAYARMRVCVAVCFLSCMSACAFVLRISAGDRQLGSQTETRAHNTKSQNTELCIYFETCWAIASGYIYIHTYIYAFALAHVCGVYLTCALPKTSRSRYEPTRLYDNNNSYGSEHCVLFSVLSIYTTQPFHCIVSISGLLLDNTGISMWGSSSNRLYECKERPIDQTNSSTGAIW